MDGQEKLDKTLERLEVVEKELQAQLEHLKSAVENLERAEDYPVTLVLGEQDHPHSEEAPAPSKPEGLAD